MRSLRPLLVFTVGMFCAATQAQQWLQQNSINWSTFKQGANSRITEQTVIELANEGDFMSYWQRSTGNPASTAPKGVDWMKQKLVAVHLGARPNSGYSVAVQSVIRNGAYATLKIFEESPLPNQYVAQIQVSPYVIIKIDRTAAVIKSEWGTRQARPSVILGPGGSYIGPKDNDGAGWVDPRYQCDWSTYRSGFECDISAPEMVVMHTESDFLNYYRRAFKGPAPRVGIDWYRYKLVAVHLGTRPTTGYGVSVRNLLKDGVYGIIRAVEETPVPGQFVTRRQTSPFVLVKVERNVVQFQLDMSSQQAKRGVVVSGG